MTLKDFLVSVKYGQHVDVCTTEDFISGSADDLLAFLNPAALNSTANGVFVDETDGHLVVDICGELTPFDGEPLQLADEKPAPAACVPIPRHELLDYYHSLWENNVIGVHAIVENSEGTMFHAILDRLAGGNIVACWNGAADDNFVEYDYGVTWRIWPRMPTDEERKAARW